MADDRMKNDDLQRNMGTSGKEGQDFGKQTPGRQGAGHESGGQHVGGQKGGNQPKNEPRNMEDDEEFGGGTTGKTGGMNRGGQNR